MDRQQEKEGGRLEILLGGEAKAVLRDRISMDSESRDVPCVRDMPSSATEFSTQIESKNFPVVLKDCVRSWPGYRKWDPSNGGLTYLKNLAGYAMVQAMMTGAGSNFYGNIRDHERVAMPFGKFMDLANTYFGGSEESQSSTLKDTGQQQEDCPEENIKTSNLEKNFKLNEEKASTRADAESKSPEKSQFYLAQVPILVQHKKEEPPLGPLIKDIFVPDFLEVESISNINMWMSCGGSRSSTHYDPYHNLLCVVSGCKKVTLWPPSAAPILYPMPLYSEASNHSAVDFAHPNLEVFSLFKDASKCSWTTILESGDALYLPEGWYHQVDSEGITLAVNIWWPSAVSKELDSHMSAYYLRRVLTSLMDAEKELMLGQNAPCNRLKESAEKEEENTFTSDCSCEGFAKKDLYCLKEIQEQDEHLCQHNFCDPQRWNCTTCTKRCKSLQRTSTRSSQGFIDVNSEKRCENHKELEDPQGARLCKRQKTSQKSERFANCSEKTFEAPMQNDDVRIIQKNPVVESSKSALLTLEELDRIYCSCGCSLTRMDEFQMNSEVQLLMPSEADQLSTLVLTVGNRLEHMALAQNTFSASCSGSNLNLGNDGQNQGSILVAKEDDFNASSQAGVASKSLSPSTSDDRDVIAEVLRDTEPLALRRILLIMVKQFPRTLEALILHLLSPVAAELLTRKFEEMDERLSETEQAGFYERFYSIFDDSHAVMEVLLAKKEAFSSKALSNALVKYLGNFGEINH